MQFSAAIKTDETDFDELEIKKEFFAVLQQKQITTLSRGFLIGMPYRWLTSQSLSAKIMSSRSPQIQVVVMVISRSFLPFYSVIICRGSPDNKGKIGYYV